MEEIVYKILVIGDIGVGKTSIIKRYTNNIFSQNYKATIGVDFAMKIVEKNDLKIRMQFWDIAGQERNHILLRQYYKDAAAAIIVFDVVRSSTLDGVIRWKNEINRCLDASVPIILVANKIDLIDDDESFDYLDNFCMDHKFIQWFKMSVKENINVESTCDKLLDIIVEKKKAEMDIISANNESVVIIDEEKKKDCCDT